MRWSVQCILKEKKKTQEKGRQDVVDDKRRPVVLEYISLVELLGVPLLKDEINIKIFFWFRDTEF